MTPTGFVVLLIVNYLGSRKGRITISHGFRKLFFVHTKPGQVTFATGLVAFCVWFYLHITRIRGFKW